MVGGRGLQKSYAPVPLFTLHFSCKIWWMDRYLKKNTDNIFHTRSWVVGTLANKKKTWSQVGSHTDYNHQLNLVNVTQKGVYNSKKIKQKWTLGVNCMLQSPRASCEIKGEMKLYSVVIATRLVACITSISGAYPSSLRWTPPWMEDLLYPGPAEIFRVYANGSFQRRREKIPCDLRAGWRQMITFPINQAWNIYDEG